MAIGWALVFQRLALVAAFRLIRFVVMAIQKVFWELNGTAQLIRQSSEPRMYPRSAQVLDVVWNVHFCEMQATFIEDFLCFHNRFEDPQYVIDNEDVTLMMVTDTSAIFCVPREKGLCDTFLSMQILILSLMWHSGLRSGRQCC